ncbi:hypothetical protein AURDEDRAFT_181273 [Auricularia subglabra TFB-10046 SS5]|nr:hypothetical protein AURDEDRAFT_181273 [Auricularia subglabra TFB-10046 SS5]
MSALSGNDAFSTLAAALQPHPHLSALLQQLRQALNSADSTAPALWAQLSAEIDRVVASQQWQPPDDARDALRVLNALFRPAPASAPDLSAALSALRESTSDGQLPAPAIPIAVQERLEDIQFAILLHTLATRPNQALPPGNSILSILARSREPAVPDNPIAARIADMMTRAFFDSASEVMAGADASAAKTRLQSLYTDLHTAFTDVLPPQLPQLELLAAPVRETDSTLLEAARRDLRSLCTAIRQRCAPARDATVDSVAQSLANAPSDTTELAKAISNAVRGLLKLAEDMKDDMLSFAAGRWREEDVRRWLREDAVVNERVVILSLYQPDNVKHLWTDWVGETAGESPLDRWIGRLLVALGASTPVSPPPPPDVESPVSLPNTVPPHFIFCIDDLVRVQNLVQALTITAALRGLVGPAPELTARLWALLGPEAAADTTQTNLTDLAAEVRHAWRTAHPDAPPDAENKLDAAVDHILRYEDPVFSLLQKRVLAALRTSIVPAVERYRARVVPLQLHAGLGQKGRPRPGSSSVAVVENIEVALPVVKGFEDPALVEGLKTCAREFVAVVRWIVDVWGDEV